MVALTAGFPVRLNNRPEAKMLFLVISFGSASTSCHVSSIDGGGSSVAACTGGSASVTPGISLMPDDFSFLSGITREDDLPKTAERILCMLPAAGADADAPTAK